MIKSKEEKYKYRVIWKRKVERQIYKCPKIVQQKFWTLVKDLREKGPIQRGWRNFSKLDENEYHCHLDYSWVAVWNCERESIIVEVVYVGSREKAPY